MADCSEAIVSFKSSDRAWKWEYMSESTSRCTQMKGIAQPPVGSSRYVREAPQSKEVDIGDLVQIGHSFCSPNHANHACSMNEMRTVLQLLTGLP